MKTLSTHVNTMKARFFGLFLAALAMLATATPASATTQTEIDDLVTEVTGYATAIGGALVAVALLFVGYRIGAKYIKKAGSI